MDDNDNVSFEHVSTIMQPTTPVKWTPEDAANFIASTIKEAQRPTIMAIRKRGVSWWIYILTVVLLLGVLSGVVYYFLWMRDAEWNGRELSWKQREAALNKEVGQLTEKYNKIVDRKLDMAVSIASDAVDNNQMSKELAAARKEIGAGEAQIEKLSLRLKDISSQNVDLARERDLAVKESQKIRAELQERKEEIASVEKIKSDNQQEVSRIMKHLALSKQINVQQKEEIKLLRNRLNTLQEMVGNLGGATSTVIAPAVNKETTEEE